MPVLSIIGLALLALLGLPGEARADPCGHCHGVTDNCMRDGMLAGRVEGATEFRQTCVDITNGGICQSRICRGSAAANSPASSCSGGDCFSKASQNQTKGLSDLLARDRDSEQSAARLRELQAKALDQAAASMDAWDRNLKTGNATEGSRDDFNRDQALVEKAARNFEGRGEFSEKDAASSHQAGVRASLDNYVQAKSNEGEWSQFQQENQRELRALRAVQARTEQRGAQMTTAGTDPANATGGMEAAGSGGATAGAGAFGHASAITKRDEASLDGKRVPASAAEANGASTIRESLRARLARELASKNKAREELDEKTFAGDLKAAGPEREYGEAPGGASSAVSQLLQPGAFSLGGSESDRQIARLMGQENADTQAGILSSESADLFRRVHEAHRSCEKRRCLVTGT